MHFGFNECAVCGDALTSLARIQPFNAGERPYFCSAECLEETSGGGEFVPIEPNDRDRTPLWYDGKKHWNYVSHEAYLDHLKDKNAQGLAEHKKTVAFYQGVWRNGWLGEKIGHDKRSAQAETAAYAKEAEKRRREEAEALLKQQEKDEAQRLREEEREEQRFLRQEEREAERQFREDEKLRLKQEEQLRKEDAERERLRPIPFTMPSDHSRFESVHILGPAGSGKTTLIQEFLKHDIIRRDSPGLIVIDPKGTLIDRVRALKILDPSRVVVIDATHAHPAKLGLFVKSNVPGVDPEQVIGQAVSTYKYIFQTTNFSFTPKQGILFEYVVRFMFEIGGTLSTMVQFLRTDFRKPHEFERHYDSLPDDMREFFTIDLRDSYESTAKEIGVRLQQIRQKPTLRAMFDTTERRVDLFDCMQKRKIVLVNTGMSRDQAASQMIGRFIIAMTLNATYVRALMPKLQWYPTFLMIDEFQEFVDAEKTPEMLRKIREYNVGVMMAHHNMYGAELDDAMRVAISTNTSVKYCADPRGMDLSYMARDFECEPSYLRAQQVNNTHVRFAHVMRRVHDTPVSVIIPRGNLDHYLKWDAPTLALHDRQNTALVHGSTTPAPIPSPPKQPVIQRELPKPPPLTVEPPPAVSSPTTDEDDFA